MMAIQQGMKADWYLGGIYVTLLSYSTFMCQVPTA